MIDVMNLVIMFFFMFFILEILYLIYVGNIFVNIESKIWIIYVYF